MARIVKQNDRIGAILGSIPRVRAENPSGIYSLCRGHKQVSQEMTLRLLWAGPEGIPIGTKDAKHEK